MGRRARIALVAAPVAGLFTHFVTMRTVYEEWGTPSFGFPLPAFGYTGTNSGAVWFALFPLSLDFVVALVVCLPVAAMIDRVLVPRLVGAVAGLAWLGILVDLAPLGFIGWFGDVHGMLRRDVASDWPVECRTAWMGPIQTSLVYEDLSDPCVRIALDRLKQQE